MFKVKLILLAVPIFFFYSLAMLTPYVSGDQINYRFFYDAAASVTFSEAFLLSAEMLDAFEPISIFVLWFGSQLGINKDIYISLLNTLLLVLLFLFLLNHKTKPILIFLFFTNFYIIVLMTGAERLKISYIFLLMGTVLNAKANIFYYFLAPFAHFQTSILLLSAFIGLLDKSLIMFFGSLKIYKRDALYFLIFILVMVIFYILFSTPLKSKFDSYLRNEIRLAEFYQLFILAGVGLLLAKNKLKVALILITAIPIIALFGGSRVNMIFFSLVAYILVIENRQNNILFIILMFYFSIKSILFIGNIYSGGDGFLLS